MITGFKELAYEERLKRTNHLSLEMRRSKADLIEVCKIMHRLYDIPRERFFTTSSTTLSGTSRHF